MNAARKPVRKRVPARKPVWVKPSFTPDEAAFLISYLGEIASEPSAPPLAESIRIELERVR